jgi:hypothetical protein
MTITFWALITGNTGEGVRKIYCGTDEQYAEALADAYDGIVVREVEV